MIARQPTRLVLTDCTFSVAKRCDCIQQPHDMVRVGRMVHAVCRSCHRDVEWPVPAAEVEATLWQARRRVFLRWLLVGLALGAVLVAVICALVPTHV